MDYNNNINNGFQDWDNGSLSTPTHSSNLSSQYGQETSLSNTPVFEELQSPFVDQSFDPSSIIQEQGMHQARSPAQQIWHRGGKNLALIGKDQSYGDNSAANTLQDDEEDETDDDEENEENEKDDASEAEQEQQPAVGEQEPAREGYVGSGMPMQPIQQRAEQLQFIEHLGFRTAIKKITLVQKRGERGHLFSVRWVKPDNTHFMPPNTCETLETILRYPSGLLAIREFMSKKCAEQPKSFNYLVKTIPGLYDALNVQK